MMNNSRLRHPCVRWMLRFLYTLILIVLIPILLVFFLPCAAAYKGGKTVNTCLEACHDSRDLEDDFNMIGDDDSAS